MRSLINSCLAFILVLGISAATAQGSASSDVSKDSLLTQEEYFDWLRAGQPKTEKMEAFHQYIGPYCITFEQLPNSYELKRKIIDSMNKSSFGPDSYFLNPGCDPQFVGATLMPMVHIVVEDSTNRLVLLKSLRTYYLEERKRPDLWFRVVNAKNTRGWTTLDYLEYVLRENKLAMPAEAKGVNSLRKFLCDNGGAYSLFKKTCPSL